MNVSMASGVLCLGGPTGVRVEQNQRRAWWPQNLSKKPRDPLCSQKIWRGITLVKFKENSKIIKGNLRGKLMEI